MVYLLKVVIFHGKLLNNQLVFELVGSGDLGTESTSDDS
jgi:hypothetical protein